MRVVCVDAEPSIPLLSFVVFYSQAWYWLSHHFSDAVSCVKAKRVFGWAHFGLAGTEPHHAYVSRTGCSFADEELETFKELCVFWQDIYSDSAQLSAVLAKAVCALSILRVHLRDKVELEDIEYNPLSRYIPGLPVKTVYDKLLPHSPQILERKREETLFHRSFVYPHPENLGSDEAWVDVLLPAHTLIMDGLPHLLFVLKRL